ncbi:M20/M25/M40 family metallo-hydrolase [Jannaschia sp. CCS1]|uniref:M20/M25/M40 family metallo-hydrolase n=1 Tax=Jannaschia sp. (strain CCS1) TaxID=290400 RepID=UPI000053CC99|nr:M20/M25/M40 family metallo-hydrolase [Jannaschia sp. CCS1]ABD56156.1 peptidase M20 [Jannaschia sp. CCS1]
MTQSPDLQAVLDYADAHMNDSLARLFDLVRIPSVSTVPAHAGDCRAAAQWLSDQLNDLGFDASVRPTGGHPMVVAHQTDADGPHVLFYGHYDVQPVVPLELWKTDPFEPTLEPQPNGDTHITGRGASDDKGQLLTFIEACRAWKAVTGRLPIKVSMLFEGEEESGSQSLGPFLEQTAEELRADVMMVCDTDMWDRDTPAITTMLRGLVGEEFTITTADRDLHSGMFGNAARNALQVASDAIAGLRGPDGGVTLPGFYDGVEDLAPEIKAQWKSLPFDQEGFLSDVGLSLPAGEDAYSIMEQIWARPSCEIHGVIGGYTDEGFKTVIPAKATAKVSFRLVAGQDPARIREAFRAHIRAYVPKDCSVEFTSHGASPALSLPLDSPYLTATREALSQEWGTEAALAGTGGSIPIVGEFKRQLGMDTLLVGFARFDNRIHSPNEKYDLSSFTGGIRSFVRVLAALSEIEAAAAP